MGSIPKPDPNNPGLFNHLDPDPEKTYPDPQTSTEIIRKSAKFSERILLNKCKMAKFCS